ncbi:NAD-dependent epimerase/dehydratase family protein [Mucilaginibacter agri]|uniref:NAD-dependent epimerase/dehydratase family protein n=1 Tax=Mucilaginibacter agri TaxID=2695265 RepID=A0A966DSQ1_9SPHI|nr:NAD-dependent epimerase/dehydratase family protein [Mucilaginibacter agri]NCD68482.1 NAD-dependent epimerase/dehydratase family protein [Mucilaginibacter agri]
MIHTIFGAGGPVANALTKQLIDHNETIRLVSRRPSTIAGKNVTWQKADLLNYAEVLQAAKGSGVIYLCAGLVYNAKIWQQQWPVIMQNMINVAKETGARLIFFDNVYMYGQLNGPMTETTPYNPMSKKGEVRAKIATQLIDAALGGNIKASIIRGADFYGAESMNSFFDSMVLAKYAKAQGAQWIGKPKTLHSFSYIPDCGKAMYLLGQTPGSDNQIWHVPTAQAITGNQFIELAADVFNTKARYSTINKLMMQLVGLFNPLVKDSVEMYYQYDHDYIFNSDKFEKYFNVKPTTYRDGIVELSETLFKS